MRATVEQTLLDKDQKRSETIEWLNTASIPELRDFMHGTGYLDAWFPRAQNVLHIRLAEETEKTAQKLVTGTDNLIAHTKTLVKLTHRLYILTIILIILGLVEFFKFLLSLVCHHAQ